MRTQRRTLVLADESAQHPFLASLPPHVRRVDADRVRRPMRPWQANAWRDFLMAYCAGFAAMMVFIA